MNILVLNYRDRSHPLAGGAEVHLHKIFGRLVELGHSVTLFTTSYKGAKSKEILDGIEVVRYGSDLSFQISIFLKVPHLIKDKKIDAVVEDLNKLPLFTPLLTKLPKLVQIHHLWKTSIFREAAFPIALAVYLGERIIPLFYKKCTFAAVSPSAKNELIELGIKGEQISVIYNGIDSELLETERVREKAPAFFLFLGRLRKYKGVWVALKAFKIFAKKYPEAKLIFAGTGSEEQKLKNSVQKWGLGDSVQFLGAVSGEKKRELLRGAIALLQTSFKEGWGLTVIEAASCGTVSIASNVSGLCDSVKDGETGLLFKAGNAADCAKKMVEIFSNSALRNNLESSAKIYASSFDWGNSATETLALLQKEIGFSEVEK
ncbi:glycosyl transferase family 1 [Fibrobacterales bacterium]|nr:glycosyl transferase family 1 [Fibrobacterales bacterium]